MLKDSILIQSSPSPQSLIVSDNLEVTKIFDFIDQCIDGFPLYYKNIGDSKKENRISDFLVNYMEWNKDRIGDFMPFRFSKNPTQPDSSRETDIGVYPRTKRLEKPVTIIEFEAKRFSETSNYQEYVCGDRGGIERFKRGLHGKHLNTCGMFGYVQKETPICWINKVNKLIETLGKENTDTTIDWTDNEERLKKMNIFFNNAIKCISSNDRKEYEDICLHHYFIDLVG